MFEPEISGAEVSELPDFRPLGFSGLGNQFDKGGTDLVDTPTTVIGVSNVPPNKDFYFLDQDTRWYVIVTFTIEVVETAPSPSTDSNTVTRTATLRVENEWEGIRSFVDTYYDT